MASNGPMVLCDNLVKIYKVQDLEVVALQGLTSSSSAASLWRLSAQRQRQVKSDEYPGGLTDPQLARQLSMV